MTTFRFGEFEVDFQLYELRRRGEAVRIDRKVFDLLRYLVEHRERVVEKPELLREVWGGDVVVDAVVPTAIARLRKALGQSGSDSTPIQTVHGRGYRFAATLSAAPPRRVAEDGQKPQLLVDTDIHQGLRDPFVGRDAVLQRLEGALSKALAGTMRARLLTGEPGIGKTRLSQELAARARAASARVWSGRCFEGDAAEPLWLWVQILRQAVDPEAIEALKGLPDSALSELRALVPELPLPRDLPEVSSTKGLPLFDAVARFLRAASERVPRVLVLDDLHWADTPSLNLLGFLLEELATARVFILGTFRDSELPPGHPHAALLDRFDRSSAWKRIALDALAPADIARYLRELTGQEPGPALVQGVHERTAGNPFFVRETVRSLTVDALSAGHLQLSAIKLPDSARDVVRRRIALLPEATRHALEAASVLGLRFDLAALAQLAAVEHPALLQALDRALAARLIVRDEASVARYAFAHALVRDTLYEDLPSTARCQLHFAAGQILDQQRALRPTSPAEIALHLHRGLPHGDGQKLFEHAKRAADQAAEAGDHAQAAQYYRYAYDGLGFVQGTDANRSAEVMLALGRAHRESGHPAEAREALDRVLELSALSGAAESWAALARDELERLRRIG